jgi:biopolymer transport protein ExbB/TolQ
MFDLLLNFLEESSSITLLVIGLLSIYFIAINWVFVYKLQKLREWKASEERGMSNTFSNKEIVSQYSYINRYLVLNRKPAVSEHLLKLVKFSATKEATAGLSILAIVASTSPFIGLFGTVVSILETFSTLGDSELGAIAVIAQGVSEALIATAVGIFVATFAYSYHQILKRIAYEVVELIAVQSETILLRNASIEEERE